LENICTVRGNPSSWVGLQEKTPGGVTRAVETETSWYTGENIMLKGLSSKGGGDQLKDGRPRRNTTLKERGDNQIGRPMRRGKNT